MVGQIKIWRILWTQKLPWRRADWDGLWVQVRAPGKRVHQGSVFACVYELPQIHMGMRACVMHYLLYVIAPVHSNIRFSIRFIRCTHLIPGLWDTNALNVAKNNYT